MSLHAIKPEIEAIILQQRRRSFITSSVIGVLAVILLMLLLSLLLLAPLFRDSPTIVTYVSNTPDEEEPEFRKTTTRVQRQPSAPSSSMARVIAALTESPVAIPVPDTETAVPSVNFGDGDDFGDGWGGGDGSGSGGGATFFNQKINAKRVAYVIDYSQSMKGPRETLMRNELKKSISGMSSGMGYQMIFFAGPAWVAGDQVKLGKGRKSATVTADRKTYDWLCGGSAHDWKTKGAKQIPGWDLSGPGAREQALKLIANTPLVWGTNWEPALEMAISMNPPPDVIFFMTDGVTGGNAEALAKDMASKAKARKITINTVAMMEPRAERAMKDLAKRTGGQFTVIEKGGNVRQVPLK